MLSIFSDTDRLNITVVQPSPVMIWLTHWGRVTHKCVGKLTSIGSDNGLSPGRRQAIIWTNGGILLIGPLGTNFSEILIKIHRFSFMKMHLKMSSGKWWQFYLGLNVLNMHDIAYSTAVTKGDLLRLYWKYPKATPYIILMDELWLLGLFCRKLILLWWNMTVVHNDSTNILPIWLSQLEAFSVCISLSLLNKKR